jgi:hypothetical protein
MNCLWQFMFSYFTPEWSDLSQTKGEMASPLSRHGLIQFIPDRKVPEFIPGTFLFDSQSVYLDSSPLSLHLIYLAT